MTEKELKKAKRLEEYIEWTANFKESSKINGIEIIYINNAPEILNDIYWTLIDNYVRPLVSDPNEEQNQDGENNVSRFKIISATELTIIHVQPIKGETETSERKLNALFGYFVALNMLLAFNKNVIQNTTVAFVDSYKESIEGIDPGALQTIQDDHLTWLELLDPQLTTPIISNAQTWRLFNLALYALEHKLPYNVKTEGDS